MEEIKDSLNIALEIINTLLQNKEIKKSENTELYQQYVGNDEVESLCDMIAEKMGFNIYRLDNTLNLCVMLDNKVFGYSNEDLKKKIKILNKNEDIYLMSDDELTSWRGKNIGYLFQNIQMSSALTVRENLMFAREFGNDKSIDVEMMLDRFGLKEVAESLPGRLSGGQKRRAMIASVLVRKPKIILADEPTNDLDHIWAEQIIEYLEKEVQPEGALVLVTHDLKWAERAKIKYKMEEGCIYR